MVVGSVPIVVVMNPELPVKALRALEQAPIMHRFAPEEVDEAREHPVAPL